MKEAQSSGWRIDLELAERIRWCRDHLDPRDRLSWGHEVGDPREGGTLRWYPSELKSLGGLFDGLRTDLLEFYSYDRQVKGHREADPPTEVSEPFSSWVSLVAGHGRSSW